MFPKTAFYFLIAGVIENEIILGTVFLNGCSDGVGNYVYKDSIKLQTQIN